ncbi:MAG: adenosylmethionine--8-amino-7-oxononanoate transaminase [Mariniblastus sp.]|nr:adenosylmethionine--8-amino-7-oxononanoate transaminase [Mariniblastus sp.]
MNHAIWLPYCQMKTARDSERVVENEGVMLRLADGRQLIDGIASWWTACHGYNHPQIVAAICQQAQQMSHVMLGGLVHEPATRLAERLADLIPGEDNKVFFSDSGSVAVEVALKIATQHWLNRGITSKNRFVCFQDAYHGDTAGAMSLCDPVDSMHAHFKGFLLEQFPTAIPTNQDELQGFRDFLLERRDRIAGVIIEPLIQMAAGFRFHSAESLAGIAQVCRELELLLILDEVATGFGRTGTMFALEQADLKPDLVCLGKGLSGGAVGLAATVASRSVYQPFHSGAPEHALMHGPTYMGNPIACAAAHASLDLFEQEPRLQQAQALEAWFTEYLQPLKADPHVVDVRCRGAVGAVQLQTEVALTPAIDFFVERGCWLRPLRDVIYLAPSFTIEKPQVETLCQAIVDFVQTR